MLRLYVWRGPDVLRRYSSGVAAALAYSVEHARDQIRVQLAADELFYWTPRESWEDDEDFASRLAQRAWLDEKPEMYEIPVVIYQQGSE